MLIAQYKFDKSIYENLIPEFNTEFTNYEIVDEYLDIENIVTRSIYSAELPNHISFEGQNSLIEIICLDTRLLTSTYNLFYNCKNLTRVDLRNSDFSNVETIERMFTYCSKLVTIEGLNELDTSKVNNMGGLFSDCSSIQELNVKDWDVSKVTNFGAVFRRCTALKTIDVSNWDTSSGVIMSGIFTNCSNLTELDLSRWNLNNANSISQMLYGCSKITAIELCTTINSEADITLLFGKCTALNKIMINNSDYKSANKIISALLSRTAADPGFLELINIDDKSQVDISTAESKYWIVTDKQLIAQYKFDKSIYANLIPEFNAGFTDYEIVDEYLDTVNMINTTTGTIMLMDYNAEPDEYGVLTTEYEVETTSEFLAENIVTRSIYAKELPYFINFGCSESNFTGVDLSKEQSLLEVIYLNVSNLTQFGTMFRCCSNLINVECSNWDTSKATMMFSMFAECTSLLKADVSNWDTSNVTTMEWMFTNCHRIETIDVSNWNTSNVTTMNSMFNGCYSLKLLDVSNWDTSKVTDMQHMFSYCPNLTSLDVSKWDTSNVTLMNGMFSACKSLNTLDVSNFNTVNVINMQYMFAYCQSLTTLDVSNWDTGNVIDMCHMFANCKSLTSLEVSNWNTGNVTTMVNMFDLCYSLVSLDVSNWNVSKVQNMYAMFGTCSSLKELNVSNWKTDSLTKADWMFNKCLNLQELDLSSWNVSNVTDMVYMLSDCESLKQLNLSNWNLNNANIEGIFSIYIYDGCKSLISVMINNSDYNSVNKVISQLPTRTESNQGILKIAGIDDITQVDIESAQSKGWNILKDKIETTMINTIVGDQFCSFVMNGKSIKIICPVKR